MRVVGLATGAWAWDTNDWQFLETIERGAAINLDAFFQCLENTPGNLPMFGKTVLGSSSTGRVYSVNGRTNLLIFDLPASPPENAWTDTVSGA